jgi:hypothetical protein
LSSCTPHSPIILCDCRRQECEGGGCLNSKFAAVVTQYHFFGRLFCWEDGSEMILTDGPNEELIKSGLFEWFPCLFSLLDGFNVDIILMPIAVKNDKFGVKVKL